MGQTHVPHRTDEQSLRSDSNNRAVGHRLPRRSVLSALGVGILGAAVGASRPVLAAQDDVLAAVSTLQTEEVLKLTASDAATGDEFGVSVSANGDGTTLLVGSGSGPDSAYVYDVTQEPPTETKLTASDGALGEFFGHAVSLSADGTTALVGALFDYDAGPGSGSAYVYDLTQSPPTETKLTANDAVIAELFGISVSVSADGTTALVGASSDFGVDLTGAAYVYDLSVNPPTETKLTASDASVGNLFGRGVSLSADGTTALIGVPGDGESGENAGAVYVFDLSVSPPAETKLTASDAAAGDLFGRSVSLSADGATALVGASRHNAAGEDAGSVYVYDLSVNPPSETKLTTSDIVVGDLDLYPRSLAVSLNADGTTALVGVPRDDAAGEDAGSVYVYDLTQSPPTVTKLTASDGIAGDEFGRGVSVSGDGTTAFVGAPWDDDAGEKSGSAYVFDLVFSEPIDLPSGTVVTPTDRDGDGLYEDLDGDGDVDGQDVSRLTRLENAYRRGQITLTAAQIAALDFNGDGQFTQADVDAYTAMVGL
jgi:hypothetical protein